MTDRLLMTLIIIGWLAVFVFLGLIAYGTWTRDDVDEVVRPMIYKGLVKGR